VVLGCRPEPVLVPRGTIVPGVEDAVIGTAHPVQVRAFADDGSWFVICQARADTDRDGRLGAYVGMHRMTSGDVLRAYVVRGGGPGDPS
jgi:hypothetical protein